MDTHAQQIQEALEGQRMHIKADMNAQQVQLDEAIKQHNVVLQKNQTEMMNSLASMMELMRTQSKRPATPGPPDGAEPAATRSKSSC